MFFGKRCLMHLLQIFHAWQPAHTALADVDRNILLSVNFFVSKWSRLPPDLVACSYYPIIYVIIKTESKMEMVKTRAVSKCDLKVALQILGRKFYKNTEKASLYTQSLLIFIHKPQ